MWEERRRVEDRERSDKKSSHRGEDAKKGEERGDERML